MVQILRGAPKSSVIPQNLKVMTGMNGIAIGNCCGIGSGA